MAYTQIDAAALERLQAAGAQIIDVRSDAEVARGFIPGAGHIALDQFGARFTELDRDRPVVLYCQSGARSASAAQFLAGQGFADVHNLQGGLIGWAAAGRPVKSPG